MFCLKKNKRILTYYEQRDAFTLKNLQKLEPTIDWNQFASHSIWENLQSCVFALVLRTHHEIRYIDIARIDNGNHQWHLLRMARNVNHDDFLLIVRGINKLLGTTWKVMD